LNKNFEHKNTSEQDFNKYIHVTREQSSTKLTKYLKFSFEDNGHEPHTSE